MNWVCLIIGLSSTWEGLPCSGAQNTWVEWINKWMPKDVSLWQLFQFGSVQFSRSVVFQLFVTPWTAACQASLSITNSQSLLRLMSIESVMSSNHLILCRPLLLLLSILPSIRSFQMSQFFTSGGQSIGVSSYIKWKAINTPHNDSDEKG